MSVGFLIQYHSPRMYTTGDSVELTSTRMKTYLLRKIKKISPQLAFILYNPFCVLPDLMAIAV